MLSPAGVTTLHTAGAQVNATNAYAIGWLVGSPRGTARLEHNGDVSNVHSNLLLLPDERLGIVVLVNANGVRNARALKSRGGADMDECRHAREGSRYTPRLFSALLDDLSAFRQIAQDTLGLVQANEVAQAKTRVTDLETAWDNDQAQMKPMSPDTWSTLDRAIDHVLTSLRAPQADVAACRTALQSLLAVLKTLDPQPSASGG